MVSLLTWSAGMYFETGTPPGVAGNHHPLASPFGVYQTKQGSFNLCAGNEVMWRRLCEAIGHPALADDARFANVNARVANRPALNAILTEAFQSRTSTEWVEYLNERGVACGPIYNLAEVFSDAQVLHDGMLVERPHPVHGTIKLIGIPIKLSETPGEIRRVPPLLNEHADEVLAEAGYSAAEIVRLREAGVLGPRPGSPSARA
jgi:crotonobetainyl-CoA:carnitine CoA-transferase CaiB-like acyl-CoA transferase